MEQEESLAEHVLIAGASGVVGHAALKHFAARPETRVTTVSRRPPPRLFGARHLALDLTDEDACRAAARGVGHVDRIVYAALYEKLNLVQGWREPDQIERNGRMLANLLDPLERTSPALRHVTLLQGTKAYGAHAHRIPLPAREDRDEDRSTPNFYWVQEDDLRARSAGKAWSWTVLRPQIIFGEALGVAMNLIPAIGAYAAMLKAEGRPLHYPGGGETIMEAVDADLLARVIAWAGEAESARNQVFNVTNGDVFTWKGVWPAIADALGMPVGEPRPMSLAAEFGIRTADWDRLRATHDLDAPELSRFVGQGFQYADFTMAHGLPDTSGIAGAALVSTVKLRQAGFTEVMDTEVMFRKLFKALQEDSLLPRP